MARNGKTTYFFTLKILQLCHEKYDVYAITGSEDSTEVLIQIVIYNLKTR
jgi:hypothetical protein